MVILLTNNTNDTNHANNTENRNNSDAQRFGTLSALPVQRAQLFYPTALLIRLLGTTCWCGLSNHQAATAQMHLVETAMEECRPLLGALPPSPGVGTCREVGDAVEEHGADLHEAVVEGDGVVAWAPSGLMKTTSWCCIVIQHCFITLSIHDWKIGWIFHVYATYVEYHPLFSGYSSQLSGLPQGFACGGASRRATARETTTSRQHGFQQ